MLPAEMDKELAWWLQEKEVVAEVLQLERDANTLEVIMEAASPLSHSLGRRLEGTHQVGGCTFPGNWAKPAIRGCGGSTACGGGYLATPPTFASSGLTTACGPCYSSAAAYV